MATLDIFIILLYLIISLIIAIFLGRKSTLDSFLVGGRSFKPIFLIFTMASTVIGVSTVFATSSAGFSSGISFGVICLIIILSGYAFISLFSKKIREFGERYKAHTMGDYLAFRYSNRTRVIGSIGIIVAYFIFFAALLLVLSQIFQIWGSTGLLSSLIFALAGVVIYTAVSGVKSDFYTDIIHFIVMFIGLVLVMLPMMINNVGGLGNLFVNLPAGYLNIHNFAGASFFWLAILFGFPLFLMYMEIWQRIFAAYSSRVVNTILYSSAIITIPFVLVGVLTGLVAYKINPALNPDTSFLETAKMFLPTGILGLVVAGVIATILSTLNSVIMVISAIFVKDIYITFVDKTGNEKRQLKIGRIITLCVGFLGIGVAYLFPSIVNLSVAANEGLLILVAPIVGGFLWKRANEKAGFYSALIGFISLWGLYPFLEKYSFVPAVILSIIVFVLFSLLNKKKAMPVN